MKGEVDGRRQTRERDQRWEKGAEINRKQQDRERGWKEKNKMNEDRKKTERVEGGENKLAIIFLVTFKKYFNVDRAREKM